MSVEDLEDYVWSDLPAMKFLAGRRLVARLTRRCAKRFPSGVMADASPEGQGRIMAEIHKAVERTERANYQMGIVLTLILSALLSEIIKAIFAWWMKSASNRALLVGWQVEDRL
jgi:hypothetical protein